MHNDEETLSSYGPDSDPLPYTTPERLVQDFVSRGIVVLGPESLGIPLETHDQIYELQKQIEVGESPRRAQLSQVPALLELINAPGLVSACNQLVGENWAIVPLSSGIGNYNARPFRSGGGDQHWHKDDNSLGNGRKQRHHQAVQVEMLYYPQAVSEEMGPTAIVPFSQYWTFNHEENHDNFAGADHLDFNYQLEGMEKQSVSGPDSIYNEEDVIHRRTAHDIRMRQAVSDLKWPLLQPFEAAPLRAGTVILYSHNLFHRGNHRRDDWRTWKDNPRFMWRFWLYRTTNPITTTKDRSPSGTDWRKIGIDPLTHIDLREATDDQTAIWQHHHHWIHTNQTPPPQSNSSATEEQNREADKLALQLRLKTDQAEPARIGAAYRLAAMSQSAVALRLLAEAFYDERESVRRAATHGLIAFGPDATSVFLVATKSPRKWIRKAATYGLGDTSPLDEAVLSAIVTRLEEDSSLYVRSVAAGSIGCLGRRAIATGEGKSLIPDCLQALTDSLKCEENRLAMTLAQKRSIKFVRPTDDSDVCEGGEMRLDFERFKPVRSAVRENALWSLVILCSHGTTVMGDALESTILALKKIVQEDENAISVGFASDALIRLVNFHAEDENEVREISNLQECLLTILNTSPIHSWDTLVRGGLRPDILSELFQEN